MVKRRAKGEGTIFKTKDGLWHARITLPDGQRKQKASKQQSVVKEWLIAERKALQDGTIVVSEKALVGEYLDRWLNDVMKNKVRSKTFESYESITRVHLVPELGHIRLTHLRPEHLQALYTKKLEAGLSNRTVLYMHSIMHKSLDQALKWGLVSRNVADLVDAPTVKRNPRPTWTKEQVKEFLAFVSSHRWGAIYYVAMLGLREAEILGLRWSDISFDTNVITIRQTAQLLKGKGIVFTQPKTEKSRRMIPMPAFVREALMAHKERQTNVRESMGEKWQDFDLVFTTNLGTPISPRNLVRHFKEVLNKLGLPDIRFYDLRHTTATLLLEKNTHPLVVSSLFGHSDVYLTLNVYSHVTPVITKEATDTLDALLK